MKKIIFISILITSYSISHTAVVAKTESDTQLINSVLHGYATPEVLITDEEFVPSCLPAEEVVIPTTRKLVAPRPCGTQYIGEDKWWTRTYERREDGSVLDGYTRVPPPIPEPYR